MRRDEKQQYLQRLCQWWVDRLKLSEWDISVHTQPVNEDDIAGCVAHDEYRRAQVMFTLDDIADENLRAIARHEMMHVPLSPLQNVADFLAGDDPVKKEMVRRATEVTCTNFTILEWGDECVSPSS